MTKSRPPRPERARADLPKGKVAAAKLLNSSLQCPDLVGLNHQTAVQSDGHKFSLVLSFKVLSKPLVKPFIFRRALLQFHLIHTSNL